MIHIGKCQTNTLKSIMSPRNMFLSTIQLKNKRKLINSLLTKIYVILYLDISILMAVSLLIGIFCSLLEGSNYLGFL